MRRVLFSRNRLLAVGAALLGGSTLSVSLLQTPALAQQEDLKQNQKLFTFGSNQYGQLGLGDDSTDHYGPTWVEQAVDIKIAAAGNDNAGWVNKQGEVWLFGRGSQNFPSLVHSLLDTPATHLSLSRSRGCVVDVNGDLHYWGVSRVGTIVVEPVTVSHTGETFVSSAVGDQHTLALTKSGKVYAFGKGPGMGLGKDRNMSKQESETPRFIAALADQKIRKVAAGANFSMFLTEEGKVFTCGKSDYGAVGSPERYIHQPSIVPMLRNKTIVDIAAGLYHAAVCTDDGSMYTFGLNKDGQLGIDTISVFNPVPQKVHLLEREIVKVAAGGGHTACLTADGALYIWGRGRDGQMGRADHLESIAAVRTLPVELDAFQGVTDVQLGGDFSIVVANKKL